MLNMNYLNLCIFVFAVLSLIFTGKIIRALIENDNTAKSFTEITNFNSNISKFLSKDIEFSYLPVEEHIQFSSDNSETNKTNKCSLDYCFNFTRCSRSFKIFVYEDAYSKTSKVYKEILKVIRGSSFRTVNPDEACLFILSIDTLDRDKLSRNYIDNFKDVIYSLKHWHNGENHVIFNFYSGTWPDYDNYYELLSTKAIIAKASFHVAYYRNNFDISFPLFHPELPYSTKSPQWQGSFASKKYLFTFKGKRYLNGIGSETRNSLHHLNNNRDILVLTTCRHGMNWVDFKDKRCDLDEDQYQK